MLATVWHVLADIISAVPNACAAVGLPSPLAIPGEALDPEFSAIVPVQDASRCMYVLVQTTDAASLAAAAGALASEAGDLLGEIANMVAGIAASGSEYSLGLPVVFRGTPVSAPPADTRMFESGGAAFSVGVLG